MTLKGTFLKKNCPVNCSHDRGIEEQPNRLTHHTTHLYLLPLFEVEVPSAVRVGRIHVALSRIRGTGNDVARAGQDSTAGRGGVGEVESMVGRRRIRLEPDMRGVERA